MADKYQIIVEAIDKLTAVFGQIKSAVTGFLGVFVAFKSAQKVIDTFVSSIQSIATAAAEQEDADKKLLQALTNIGAGTQKALQEQKDFASAIQATTKFSDDQVQEVQSLIASLGKLEGQGLKRATKAALDFASATGTDASAAATLIGKAAAGSTTALARYGLIIDENIPKNEKFAAAMGLIERRFGGAAEAMGSTFTGRIVQLQNVWGELREEMGKNITQSPEVIAAIDSIKESLLRMVKFFASNDFRAQVGEVVLGLAKIGNVAAQVAGVLSVLIDPWTGFGSAVAKASFAAAEGMDRLAQSIEVVKNKREFLEFLKKQLAAGLVSPDAIARIKELEQELGMGLPTAVKNTAAAIEETTKAIEESEQRTHDIMMETARVLDEQSGQWIQIGEAVKKATDERKALNDAFDRSFSTDTNAELMETARVLDVISGKWITIAEATAQAKNEADAYEKEVKRIEERQEAAARMIADFGAAMVRAALEGGQALKDFAKAFMKDMAAMIIRALILAAIMTYIRGGSFSTRFLDAILGVGTAGANKGGQVLRAQGGLQVPGPRVNRDLVPALLTPGEVVVRNPVVEEVERRLIGGGGGGGFMVQNNFNNMIDRDLVERFTRKQNELAEHMGLEVVSTRVVEG